MLWKAKGDSKLTKPKEKIQVGTGKSLEQEWVSAAHVGVSENKRPSQKPNPVETCTSGPTNSNPLCQEIRI